MTKIMHSSAHARPTVPQDPTWVSEARFSTYLPAFRCGHRNVSADVNRQEPACSFALKGIQETGRPVVNEKADLLLLRGVQCIWEGIEDAISERHWVYRTLSSFSDLEDALAIDVKIILADAAFLPELNRHYARLHKHRPPSPALFIVSAHSDIESRILSLQADPTKVFHEPFDLNLLIGELEKIMRPKTKPAIRVLIVADDEAKSQAVTRILQDMVVTTRILKQPVEIFDTIWQFRPDLILITELQSSDVDRSILTRLIREREESIALPVVHICDEYDQEKTLQALQAGADDLLSFSMTESWLAAAISCRIERAKAISNAGIYASESTPDKLHDRKAMLMRIALVYANRESIDALYGLVTIALGSTETHASLQNGIHSETVIRDVAESLGPILQSQDYIARTQNNYLSILVHRNSKNELDKVTGLVAELVNYRVKTHELSIEAFGIDMSILNGSTLSSEKLLMQGEQKAEADCRQKTKSYESYRKEDSLPGLEVKEGTAWLKDEFILALDAGTATFREQRFVCLSNSISHIETIALMPELCFSGSHVDIYQHAALSDSSDEFDKLVFEIGAKKLYESTLKGKPVRLIIRQSPNVLDSDVYIEAAKETFRRLHLVGNGLVLEFPLPLIASRLRSAAAFFAEVASLGIATSLSNFPCNESGYKALAYLKADIVRPRRSNLYGEAKSIEQIANRIHARRKEIILPAVEHVQKISRKWLEYADYIQDDYRRLELLKSDLPGAIPSTQLEGSNSFWIV